MRCRYRETRFYNERSGYCVCVFLTEDHSVPQGARHKHRAEETIAFTAVGMNLPQSDHLEVELSGKWEKTKYGLQFLVESYTELLPQTEDGIYHYLASGLIKGVGPRTAERIVERFGERTFEVIEQYPESLLEIRGISRNKLDMILKSYGGNHVIRELAAELAPFSISPKKIQKVYEEFGEDAVDVVRNRPFCLCRISGFSFLAADEIARKNNGSPTDPNRLEEGVLHCLEQEAQAGHLYQDMNQLKQRAGVLLNAGYRRREVDDGEIARSIYTMIQEKRLHYEAGMVYLERFYRYELITAKCLARLLAQESPIPQALESWIEEAQRELHLVLSEMQKNGVREAFSHQVSIITGGPGTGKTTVEKVILTVYQKLGDGSVLLVAPTGRASRRMADCTGCQEAYTMHSALGLVNEELEIEGKESLDADLILVDECSMIDMRLAYEFFRRIQTGTRLVLIGDVNQLPSVGPGNVLRELIQCGRIPVTILDRIFRQGEGSRIIENAHRMLNGRTDLQFGEDFAFLPCRSPEEAAKKIEEEYQSAVSLFGLSQVQVLSPYRKRSEAGVNALNEVLRELMNPANADKAERKTVGLIFREGDKVIQNKNMDPISNGDIGYITEIAQDEDVGTIFRIAFSGGRCVEYSEEDMEMMEHAYATTIHKAQGDEFEVVILPWLSSFFPMLQRNILYTAVTRAKRKVILAGELSAIARAIHNTRNTARNTMLGKRINQEYQELPGKQETISFPDGKTGRYEQMVMNF